MSSRTHIRKTFLAKLFSAGAVLVAGKYLFPPKPKITPRPDTRAIARTDTSA